MSKKIKTVWDSDPTAADDTAEESYFAGEDSNGDPIAYSATQLAGMTGARNEIPTLRSDVDSIIETISSQPVTGQFTLTAPTPNTLTILVSAIPSAAIDRYAFYWDTDGTPSGTDGVAKSVAAGGTLSFTTSLANSSETEPYVNQAPGYLHVRSASGSVWSALTPPSENNDGSNGFLIQAIDTLGYVWQQGATSIALGTDHTTDIVVTVDTPPVANIPQTGTLLYNLWDNISHTKLRSNVASPISYTSPVAGVSLQCYVTIADGAGKITSSTDPYGGTAGYLPITLETPANGFVAIELSSYSVDEDAGPFVPTFVLVDENGDPLNATGDVTFDVTTISRTALSGDTLSFDTTSDIDTGTDVISITGHGLVDGDTVCTAMKGGSATPGYTDHETYYVNAPSVDTLTLHTSFADALAGTSPVNLTSGGGETHYLISGAFESVSSVTQTIPSGSSEVDLISLSGAGATGIELVQLQGTANNMFELSGIV